MSRSDFRPLAVITAATVLVAAVCMAGQPVVEVPASTMRNAPHGMGLRPGADGAAQTASLEGILSWSTITNEVVFDAGTPMGKFVFSLTNISASPVVLTAVGTSCGCTAAHLPNLPTTVQPAASMSFEVDMNIAGKHGMVEKTVTLSTDKGEQKLYVISNIKDGNAPMAMSDSDRRQNLEASIADRQAVFRDDCARCHVEPARNKTGKDLFVAVCGVCHEAEHRASMVPDLHNLPVETSAAFWSTWITYGKPNTLMPAFAKSQGGILTQEQITSLVDYLVQAFPPKPVPAMHKLD